MIPKSVHSMSPGWITASPSSGSAAPRRKIATEGWNQVARPNAAIRSRYHQTRSAAVVVPGLTARAEKPSAMMRWAMRTISG